MSVGAGPSGAVTEILHAATNGDVAARERLWAAVYADLHHAARRQLRNERHRATIQTTMLVHEAYLRLVGSSPVDWTSRRHFFGAAIRAMRQILVDFARKQGAQKRGGAARRVSLDVADLPVGGIATDGVDPLALDEALTRLETEAPRAAEVVQLQYFAGLTGDEIARQLGVSPRTVDNDSLFARAWLRRELSKGG
ncbi:MAG: sigma-70 family RNA polymerase sigma factor [Phycisphaerales bacterium]|nr:sigma-70 family RNA polymerase sigma factor [Phycisphaerales bacterium]